MTGGTWSCWLDTRRRKKRGGGRSHLLAPYAHWLTFHLCSSDLPSSRPVVPGARSSFFMTHWAGSFDSALTRWALEAGVPFHPKGRLVTLHGATSHRLQLGSLGSVLPLELCVEDDEDKSETATQQLGTCADPEPAAAPQCPAGRTIDAGQQPLNLPLALLEHGVHLVARFVLAGNVKGHGERRCQGRAKRDAPPSRPTAPAAAADCTWPPRPRRTPCAAWRPTRRLPGAAAATHPPQCGRMACRHAAASGVQVARKVGGP